MGSFPFNSSENNEFTSECGSNLKLNGNLLSDSTLPFSSIPEKSDNPTSWIYLVAVPNLAASNLSFADEAAPIWL